MTGWSSDDTRRFGAAQPRRPVRGDYPQAVAYPLQRQQYRPDTLALGKGAGMMTEPLGQSGGMLAQVREGMTVYDRDHEKVGTVKQVYFGGEDLSEATVSEDSVLAEVPAALRGRLAASGFIEIAPGLLAAHRYAAGSQVAGVDSEGVRLTIARDELPKK
jgi:hypothetical protein